jgi:hypothetical protein
VCVWANRAAAVSMFIRGMNVIGRVRAIRAMESVILIQVGIDDQIFWSSKTSKTM